MPISPAVYFIGFRGEEYWSALRVWGKPDHIWPKAAFRVLGECAPDDVVIFGPAAFERPEKWRRAE